MVPVVIDGGGNSFISGENIDFADGENINLINGENINVTDGENINLIGGENINVSGVSSVGGADGVFVASLPPQDLGGNIGFEDHGEGIQPTQPQQPIANNLQYSASTDEWQLQSQAPADSSSQHADESDMASPAAGGGDEGPRSPLEALLDANRERSSSSGQSSEDGAEARTFIFCLGCYGSFRSAKYLAAHVRNKVCAGAKGHEFQCPRCGSVGGAEWAASHDFRHHQIMWERNWVRPNAKK